VAVLEIPPVTSPGNSGESVNRCGYKGQKMKRALRAIDFVAALIMSMGILGLIFYAAQDVLTDIEKQVSGLWSILWSNSYGRILIITFGIAILWCFIRRKHLHHLHNIDS
jgi:hypothetical protein